MDKQQTQQPVAWIDDDGMVFWKDGIPPDGTDLFAAQPVPRDVLMAFGKEVHDAAINAAGDSKNPSPLYGVMNIDLATIADRYASKVRQEPIAPDVIDALVGNDGGRKQQPEPVNQQMLEDALECCRNFKDAMSILNDGPDDSDVAMAEEKLSAALKHARTAIAGAAEAAQPVESGEWRTNDPNVSGEHIKAIAKVCGLIPSHTTRELVDRVVGFGHVLLRDKAVQEKFVEANAHLLRMFQQPASVKPVAVPDVLEQLQLAETEVINAKAWSAGEQAKTHCKHALTAIAVARSLLYAAQKQEGVCK